MGRKPVGHMHDVRIFKQSATPGNIIVVVDGHGAQTGARAPNGRKSSGGFTAGDRAMRDGFFNRQGAKDAEKKRPVVYPRITRRDANFYHFWLEPR